MPGPKMISDSDMHSDQLNAAETFLRDIASSTTDRHAPLICSREEAIVYFVSRGKECADWIDVLKREWISAATEARAPKSDERFERVPFVRFWVVEHAAMLRAVQWCELAGFEVWFEQLAEAIEKGHFGLSGIDGVFDFARSDRAIATMQSGLRRDCYAAVSQSLRSPNDFDLASGTVFAASALRLGIDLQPIIAQLLGGQRLDGGWPYYASAKDSHVSTTARAVHALALAKPSGWETAVKRASDFLWSMQETDGSWDVMNAKSASLRVADTVLVLDAIELASGGTQVTFSVEQSDDGKPLGRNKSERRRPGAPVPPEKLLLGQTLQWDWRMYRNNGGPRREDAAYDEWRLKSGLSRDFGLSRERAKSLRRWFTFHTKTDRNPGDADALKGTFELTENDRQAITEWLDSESDK